MPVNNFWRGLSPLAGKHITLGPVNAHHAEVLLPTQRRQPVVNLVRTWAIRLRIDVERAISVEFHSAVAVAHMSAQRHSLRQVEVLVVEGQ